jgi:3-deoxy-D-glycero-D-galacto-nononate 9-phosphate synthase
MRSKMEKKCYIIAEAGQNHNGSMKMARQLIDVAAMPIIDKAFNTELKGVDAIKFTKRDLSEELTKVENEKVYNSPNAFGKTYGEHRAALELDYEQHIELFKYAKERDLNFIETLTSLKTLKLLENVRLDYIKVASRDLTNIPLLEEIAKSKIPVIISTGMAGVKEIDDAFNLISKYHDLIIILHCVSQYPAEYQNLNLKSIPFLKDRYKTIIGYSDHSIGIVAPVMALALGAEFIEKHITLSHALKGSDHKGALEPDGLWRMVRDIRNMELAVGNYEKTIVDAITDVKIKLERSLSLKKSKSKGEVIMEDDLEMLSPGGGLSWHDKINIIGKKLLRDTDGKTTLTLDMVEN